jgi:hypothetical protein
MCWCISTSECIFQIVRIWPDMKQKTELHHKPSKQFNSPPIMFMNWMYFPNVPTTMVYHLTQSHSYNWDNKVMASYKNDTNKIRKLHGESRRNLKCRLWRVSSSGIWRCVARWVSTDVSEEHIASIFRVEEIGSANQYHIPEDDTLHNLKCLQS